MDLTEAERLAISLMKRFNVPSNWRVVYEHEEKFDGVCHHNVNCITLNPSIVERGDRTEVTAIILHEIAHALVGPGHRHDKVWHDKLVDLIRVVTWG